MSQQGDDNKEASGSASNPNSPRHGHRPLVIHSSPTFTLDFSRRHHHDFPHTVPGPRGAQHAYTMSNGGSDRSPRLSPEDNSPRPPPSPAAPPARVSPKDHTLVPPALSLSPSAAGAASPILSPTPVPSAPSPLAPPSTASPAAAASASVIVSPASPAAGASASAASSASPAKSRPPAVSPSSVPSSSSGSTGLGSPRKEDPTAYHTVHINHIPAQREGVEMAHVSALIRDAVMQRRRFVFFPKGGDVAQIKVTRGVPPPYTPPTAGIPTIPAKSAHKYKLVRGVYCVTDGDDDKTAEKYAPPTIEEFFQALTAVMKVHTVGPARTHCHKRLHVLSTRFKLHLLLNSELELKAQKAVPHRDFYNVRKIDNHIHHSACMNQKHLLRFIKYKLKDDGDEVVMTQKGGVKLTLKEVFDSLKLSSHDLNVDTLDVHAEHSFHRFDKFNLKYNPIGQSHLRTIFLKYNNEIAGKYLAQVTREVFDDLELNKYQYAEYRVSIYGRDKSEWDVLAAWIIDFELFSYNMRWMIQLPRLYAAYRADGSIKNFQQMLDNFFLPLFEVTIDPSTHPKLHLFLESCVGFDCVDDESQREMPSMNGPQTLPEDWTDPHNPPYVMFGYYMYANLYALNKLRESKGFSTFAFRPHAGEMGDLEHLAVAFLTAKSIAHGIVLHDSPALQYLFYLCQVGISVSPLSNNLLCCKYEKNPFPTFFARGLNVTLSTDDPLMIHVTKEPLVEEYSVAAQVWKLTSVDMCEIARNSVLQSDFEPRFKKHWLGAEYNRRGTNDIHQTNVPNIRMEYRHSLLCDELKYIASHLPQGQSLGIEHTDPL